LSIRDQYYFGLNPYKIAYEDPAMIVAIEAASYCEECGEQNIRFKDVEERSNKALNEITNGARPDFGGHIVDLINDCCRRGFLSSEKVSRKKTWISPDIPAVKKKVNAMRIENTCNNRLRPVSNLAKLRVDIPLSDTVSISEGLSMTVTRANQK
jgi:hypothetical protein